MRILHFSDPHFDLSLSRLPLKKWFGKRAIGALNLLAGRGRHFDGAEQKIAALNRFKDENNVDLVLCTGDYTALGLDAELREAAEFVAPLMNAPLGYITVPGNHDIYAKDVIKHQYFSRYFGAAMQTDMPQYCVDGPWPFVRLIGEQVAVVGVNSSKPNPVPWRSDGHIPSIQLASLNKILADPALQGRFVFMMTHYAARLEDGSPDSKLHGLHNADDFLEICQQIPNGALLCGHIHRCYRTPLSGLSVDLYCAGSATKDHREGFWLFDIENGQCRARQGCFDPGSDSYMLRNAPISS